MSRRAFIFPVFLVAASCSTDHFVKSADTEVQTILQQTQLAVLPEPAPALEINTPFSELNPKYLQPEIIVRQRQTGDEMRRISLEEAIEISIRTRRDYQAEKEALYLVALDLTRARHDYSPRLTSLGSEAGLSSSGLKNANGDYSESDRQTSIRSRGSFDQAFATGGALAIDLAQDIFQFYLGGTGAGRTRFLSARLAQPLLRGRGAIATESLTQRERNVAYSVRNFSRFQQRNVIDITAAYFRILQEKDRVRNEFSSYKNLVVFADRARALAEDRLPRFQLDQAKQSELRARARYISAVNSYHNLVDNFKLTLGLPLGGGLFLEDGPLRSLENARLPEIPFDSDPALQIAINHRLDLFNEIDRFEDAKRRIQVAADAFKPGIDLFAGLDLDSTPGNYAGFDIGAYQSRIGIDLDLPIDNLEARNDFRRVRIEFERQLRVLSLAMDRIHADLRSGLRGLELSRQTHAIQRNALKLATSRVEGADLLLELGRASTRDLLESQNDQLTARNAVTSALVDYHLTRLNLLYNMGIFDPDVPEFWLRNPPLPHIHGKENRTTPVTTATTERLVTPEELFQEPPPRS